MSTPAGPGGGTPASPGAPKRRSIKEKMKDAPRAHELSDEDIALTSGAGSAPNPAAVGGASAAKSPTESLTHTSIGGFTIPSDTSTSTFQIGSDGAITDAPAAPISPGFSRDEGPRPLDLSLAEGHHLFLVGKAVDPEELEALAVSIWEDAGWLSAGVLRLSHAARIEGPWEVSPAERRQLGTPADLTQAWVLYCPPERGRPPIPGKGAEDQWTRAFPGGVVSGFELRTLLNLERMARRLAGALHIAGSGAVIAPDPDSAVGLTVCAPRWLDPEHLIGALKPEFPTIMDSRDLPIEAPRHPHGREVQRVAALHDSLAQLPDDVRETIEKARQEAMKTPAVVDTYALVTDAGNKSRIVIEIQRLPRAPHALRWEEWARGTVIGYTLRWTVPGLPAPPTKVTSRAMRLERLRVAEDIEQAAATIASLVGGAVIDEDGFLVALDPIDE